MIEEGETAPDFTLQGSDGERTVQYVWQAQSNWDRWRVGPINEINECLRALS